VISEIIKTTAAKTLEEIFFLMKLLTEISTSSDPSPTAAELKATMWGLCL
jgi:hypothetical protein